MGSDIPELDVNGSTGLDAVSSARYKTNIVPMTNRYADAILNHVKPVEFDFVGTTQHACGFIAEDIEQVLPEFVIYKDKRAESIDYQKFIAPLVQIIQNLNQRISELEKNRT